MTDLKVVEFRPEKIEPSPDIVLEAAKEQYSSLIIIGWGTDDVLDVRASGDMERKADMLYLLETVVHKLMNGDYDQQVES